MAKFKVRRIALFTGGIQVGESGNAVGQILAGSTSGCMPAMNASTAGTGSIAITGVVAADHVFVTPIVASGIAVTGATAIAGGASLSLFNITGANANASTINFRYFVIGAS